MFLPERACRPRRSLTHSTQIIVKYISNCYLPDESLYQLAYDPLSSNDIADLDSCRSRCVLAICHRLSSQRVGAFDQSLLLLLLHGGRETNNVLRIVASLLRRVDPSYTTPRTVYGFMA
jgi:hypothetical protein